MQVNTKKSVTAYNTASRFGAFAHRSAGSSFEEAIPAENPALAKSPTRRTDRYDRSAGCLSQ